MGLFGTKNYASIVAPLKKIVADLNTYMQENDTANQADNDEIVKRQNSIKERTVENNKSQYTIEQVNKMLAVDLDEDGIADVDELPPVDETATTEE